MRFLIALILICMTALTAAASVFRSVNRLYVVPVNRDTFEVIEDRGAGASDIWCSAADYAQAAGLDGVRKRMYILEPRGKSRTTPNATGVLFTTSPSDDLKDTPHSYSVTINRKGEEFTYQPCL